MQRRPWCLFFGQVFTGRERRRYVRVGIENALHYSFHLVSDFLHYDVFIQ
jgi:hypothetical protein